MDKGAPRSGRCLQGYTGVSTSVKRATGTMTTHGTKSAYNRGCRCVACKEASRLARARQRQTARERAEGAHPEKVVPTAVDVPEERIDTEKAPPPDEPRSIPERRTEVREPSRLEAVTPESPSPPQRPAGSMRAPERDVPSRTPPPGSSAPSRTDNGLRVFGAREPASEASKPQTPRIGFVTHPDDAKDEQPTSGERVAQANTWAASPTSQTTPASEPGDTANLVGPARSPVEKTEAKVEKTEAKVEEAKVEEAKVEVRELPKATPGETRHARLDLVDSTVSTSADAWQEISKRLVRAQQHPAKIAPLATDLSTAVTRALSDAEAAFSSGLGRRKAPATSTEAPRASGAPSGHEDRVAAQQTRSVESGAEPEGRASNGPVTRRQPSGHEPRRSLFGGLSRKVSGSRSRSNAPQPPPPREPLPPPPKSLPSPPAPHLPPPPAPLPPPPRKDVRAEEEKSQE